jgi:DNA-binding MarR family transcriptional regulator
MENIDSVKPVGWTLLSNYAHVLICLAEDSSARLREVAVRVGITERAVQRIVSELEGAQILEKERHGRRNQYLIRSEKPLRHPLEEHCSVGSLLDTIIGPASKEMAAN